MNPSEGRVPVSWNECADWKEAGGVVLVHLSDGWQPTTTSRKFLGGWNFDANRYRLLPPPGLVAAPEGMDGGGWLGQGKDVPDGWEWRQLVDIEWRAGHPLDHWIVQCRPPAPKREPEWVPLTKLVGRTVWGETEPVERYEGYSDGVLWFAHDRVPHDVTFDADGRVKVEPEEEQ